MTKVATSEERVKPYVFYWTNDAECCLLLLGLAIEGLSVNLFESVEKKNIAPDTRRIKITSVICALNHSLFVYVEVLWPCQLNEVMSSAVSLSNHTFTGHGQA